MLEIVFFYVLCFTRPRYQVSVYRTICPLVQDYHKVMLFYMTVISNCLEEDLCEPV